MKSKNIFTILTGIALVLSFSVTSMSQSINPCFSQCLDRHPDRGNTYWQCIGWCKSEQGGSMPVKTDIRQSSTKRKQSRRRK